MNSWGRKKSMLDNAVIIVAADGLAPLSWDAGRVVIIVTQITRFMGPTWGPPWSCPPQMGPTLAPWSLLSGKLYNTLGPKLNGKHFAHNIFTRISTSNGVIRLHMTLKKKTSKMTVSTLLAEYGSLWGESTGNWTPLTKSQRCRALMLSSSLWSWTTYLWAFVKVCFSQYSSHIAAVPSLGHTEHASVAHLLQMKNGC